MSFDCQKLTSKFKITLQKNILKGLRKELNCLEKLGLDFYVCVVDGNGQGTEYSSVHAIPVLKKFDDCKINIADEIANVQSFDKRIIQMKTCTLICSFFICILRRDFTSIWD